MIAHQHILGDTASVVGIRLSGTGGQGLVLMGHLLSEALAIYGSLNVVMTKAYGPEARGGASRTDIIVGSGEINDLAATHVDILVCLSQQACDKYYPNLVPNGIFILDSTNVPVVPTNRAIELPMTATAAESCKSKIVTNIIALGVLGRLIELVPRKSYAEAMKEGIKPQFQELNQKAFDIGWKMGTKVAEELTQRQQDTLDHYRDMLLHPSEPTGKKAAKPSASKHGAKKGNKS